MIDSTHEYHLWSRCHLCFFENQFTERKTTPNNITIHPYVTVLNYSSSECMLFWLLLISNFGRAGNLWLLDELEIHQTSNRLPKCTQNKRFKEVVLNWLSLNPWATLLKQKIDDFFFSACTNSSSIFFLETYQNPSTIPLFEHLKDSVSQRNNSARSSCP